MSRSTGGRVSDGFVPLGFARGCRLEVAASDVMPGGVGGASLWGADGALDLGDDATHTVIALGLSEVAWQGLWLPLAPGMFVVVPGALRVKGRAWVLRHDGYRGLFQLGGPPEATGRLRYIDGCTDTLVAGPARRGEPCLNHLHLPVDTDQSSHVHPSARLGTIVGGEGTCRTPGRSWPLTPGLAWYIPTGSRHAFRTEGRTLDVLAWHPDSDTGPTDDDHPMVNRTWDPRPL